VAHTDNSPILLSSNSSKSSPPYTLSQRKQLRVEEKLYLKEVKRSIAVYTHRVSMNLPSLELPTLDQLPWSDTPRNVPCRIACRPMRGMARTFSEENHRLDLGDPKAENLACIAMHIHTRYPGI
jgi:hypothetical protein